MAFNHKYTVHIIDEFGRYKAISVIAASIRENSDDVMFYDVWDNLTGKFRQSCLLGYSRDLEDE